jgi:hypothetical protein
VSNPLLKKNYIAGASGITPYSIVKFSGSGTVVLAAATADLAIGVTDAFCNPNQGDRLDVMHIGIAQVQLGGAITRGNQVTSDANGHGVVLASGISIGVALESGVSGDIIPVLLCIASS